MASTSLIGTTEAAARLGITPQAVRARIKAGTLVPHAQVGRGYVFLAEQLEALIAEAAA